MNYFFIEINLNFKKFTMLNKFLELKFIKNKIICAFDLIN
jgi:hypothetical protein